MRSLLSVKNLSKSYKVYKSEFLRFLTWFGFDIAPLKEHFVLKNISFDIYPGESLGIIGQNGAGKSTLLKLITGCLRPSTGNLQFNGNISSILELGMGFDENLSGRQNTINSLSMMGFSAKEINKLVPKVEEFSEIGIFFDKPCRLYSTGMQARVAFSIATAHRPQLLIVDEVLSVGDTYFQHKSFGRIRDFQNKGTSLLIVSHDKGAILNSCKRAILLERGSIIKDGNPEEVFDFYNALIAKKEKSTIEFKYTKNNKQSTKSGTSEVTVEEIALYNSKNEISDTVTVGELVELHIKIKCFKSVESLVFGYGIKDRLGQIMFGTNTWHTKQVIKDAKSGDQYIIKLIFAANFGVGSYSVQTALVDGATHLIRNYEWLDMALIFDVINFDKATFEGCLWNEPKISIESIE